MPKPDWLKIKIQGGKAYAQVEQMLKRLSLHTVCKEANCPNRMECFESKTATFLILGDVCTRNCTFCSVNKGTPNPIDANEPFHVAQGVKELGLEHVVVTSVNRDDLPDGGAAHFKRTIEEIRKLDRSIVIEVLIPDFNGSASALQVVADAKPDIINHNIETVPRLYGEVRPMAVYERSLALLKTAKEMDGEILTKSGIMLGLGEAPREVEQAMRDLRDACCDLLTIGQYLAPSKNHHAVVEYVHPDVFGQYKVLGEGMGFRFVASAPLVRSSYMAAEAYTFART